jgi:hypothetical protein
MSGITTGFYRIVVRKQILQQIIFGKVFAVPGRVDNFSFSGSTAGGFSGLVPSRIIRQSRDGKRARNDRPSVARTDMNLFVFTVSDPYREIIKQVSGGWYDVWYFGEEFF